MILSAREHELRHMASALNTGQYADYTLECQGHSIPVHKIIISSKSSFFRGGVSGSFSESQDALMSMPDDDPAILARAVTFMYTGIGIPDIFVCRKKEDDKYMTDEALLHAHVFAFAEKYDIPMLRDFAKVAFLKAWYGDDSVGGAIGCWFDEDLRDVIRAVYTTTAAPVMDLRSAVLAVFLCYQESDDIRQRSDVRLFYCECSDFGVDMATYTLAEHPSCCSFCHKMEDVVVDECACGKVNYCTDETCRQKWCQQTYCLYCFSLGTMGYPDKGEEDENVDMTVET